MSKEMWNERYSADEYAYGTEPNEFFRKNIEQLPPGKILLPGDGEGRNAVFAARLGWDVTAFDMSEEGRAKAFKLASENKVNIKYFVTSFEDFSFDIDYFDVIVMIFVHFPPLQRELYHKKLLSCLKPGGKLIMEAFDKEQVNFNSGGPREPSMLYTLDELKGDFQSLHLTLAQKTKINLSEGLYHKGEAMVLRIAGTK